MFVLQLIRELGTINVKKKEPPFCYPYSLKARVLVLAHLARMDVSEELEEGRIEAQLCNDLLCTVIYPQLYNMADLLFQIRGLWSERAQLFFRK